ncbi:MAG: Hsp20/alpha crystallin family protein [Thermodesulfobacteriota bacterium]
MMRLVEVEPRFDYNLGTFGGVRERRVGNWLIPESGIEECEWMPASDISETDTAFLVSMELPGIDMKKLDITYSNGTLTVKGEKQKETVIGETCNCSERYAGSFTRRFQMPGPVFTDKIDAAYRDGVLRISLPKSEVSIVKKVEVH